jgi:8-oxo-dGTP pyrophosphatase MutT (NUDIX family)
MPARSVDHGSIAREVCAVPIRVREQQVEFCLISLESASRWEFPHMPIGADEPPLEAARRCLMEQAGLKCRPVSDEPLDTVMATQNRRLVQLVAFLLEVEFAESADLSNTGRKIRWCLAEEARARIRRKPMRRLIDLALRRLPS